MAETIKKAERNIIDFARYQQSRERMPAMSARLCRHCGAALQDGENEDECSSAFNFSARPVDTTSLRWQAAQILRGLV
jgi:hypothetical protein